MDGLRLALIVFGIVVVAVVYLWTARRRRLDREAGEFDRFDAWTDSELDPLAPSATNDGVSRDVGVVDDGVVDADDLTQPNLRSPASQKALRQAVDEHDSVDRDVANRQAERAAGHQRAVDSAHGGESMSGNPSLDEGEVIDDLEAIVDSLDVRAEPRIGALDDIELRGSHSGPTIRAPTVQSAGQSRPAPRSAAGVRHSDARKESPGEKSHADDSDESGASADLVVVLNVMARAGQTLDGPALKVALEGAGLMSGDMHLYHYRAETQADDAPAIFSALNVVKPGTLDVNAFDGMRTPGIALVLRMSGVERPSESFELMLAAARRMAGELDAQVCDESRSTLSGQALNHLRERIAAMAFRARSGG